MKINGGKPLQAPLAQAQEQKQISEKKKLGKQPSDPLDQLKLSQQALSFLRQQQTKEKEQKSALELLLNPKQKEEDSADVQKEMAKIQKNCAKIAARIRKGDIVPLKDMRYLMKHDPRLYMLTMSMRQEKEDPKKWKSVLKPGDEEKQTTAVGEAATCAENTAVSEVSASAETGGGAETGSTGTQG